MPRGAKSRMRRTETTKLIWIKLCTVLDITDIVAYRNFGQHRLRIIWWRGSNLPLSDRLSSSPLLHSRTTVRTCDYPRKSFREGLWNHRRAPSSISEIQFLAVGEVKRPILHHHTKFRKDRSNRCGDIAIFCDFQNVCLSVCLSVTTITK